MARYNAGARTSAVGSTSRAFAAVWGATASGARIREISASNTTTTAVEVCLKRMTAVGAGQGTQITAANIGKHDPISADPACTFYHSATADHTIGDDLGYRFVLGAAAGAGVIWTFGDTGLVVPVGTANGIGLFVENGSAQILQVDFVWDE